MSARPLPRPTPLTQPFWDGCREGRLRVQRCARCARCIFVPQPVCPDCGSDALAWIDSAGRGRVYSWSVVHRPPGPGFEVPYVVAIVELDEGFSMLTNLVACEPEQVGVGLPVRVVFERIDARITLPFFTPEPAA